MTIISRRHFVAQLSAAAFCGSANRPAAAIDPFPRQKPHIKGPSLSAYSLRSHMRWWKGRNGEGDMEMLDFLDYCAEIGLDAAELTSYFFPPEFDQTFCRRLRRHAHLLGIDLSGGAIGNNFTHLPTSDEGRRQLDATRLWIDRFSDMGIVPLRIFAGKPADGMPPQVALRNVIDNMHEILPHAQRRGVMLGVENHDFTSEVDRLLELVGSIDSDWFGVTWDSANVAGSPNPYRELARIAPYAITAQIKVSTRVNDEMVPADFSRLIGILRAARFRGYVVLEYEEPEDPLEAIPGHLTRLRQAMQV